MHALCPGQTFANDDRVRAHGHGGVMAATAGDLAAPRFVHEYQALQQIPLLKLTELGAGDAFIVPEHRKACGSFHQQLLRNGTAAFGESH